MNPSSLATIAAALRSGAAFLITSHANPDGDSIGSMLAVRQLLQAMGKERILCLNDDPAPRIYRWLPGAGEIVTPERLDAPPVVDIAIIVDAASKARLGKTADLIPAEATLIVIDHHLEERPDGDLVFVDRSYAAVGEILVELFETAGVPMSREAAICLYVSITTDTGGFRYANTTPRSHRLAAALLEAGVDAADVSSRVFDMIPLAKAQMLRRVLERMQRIEEGRVAYSTLTQEDLREANARTEDTDGLINFVRNLEGVHVGILFRELDRDSTKVSMRSRDTFNCAEFLQRCGGGGHPGAAGVTLAAPLAEARAYILDQIHHALEGSA